MLMWLPRPRRRRKKSNTKYYLNFHAGEREGMEDIMEYTTIKTEVIEREGSIRKTVARRINKWQTVRQNWEKQMHQLF